MRLLSKLSTGLAVIIGGAVGTVMVKYLGVVLLLPVISIILIWLFSGKFFPIQKKQLVPVFSVLIGFSLYKSLSVLVAFALGALSDFSLEESRFIEMLIIVIFLGFVITWLVIKPNLIAVLLLTIYQLFALFMNLVDLILFDIDIYSDLYRVRVIDVILRLLMLFLLGRLFVAQRRLHSEPQVPTL